MGVARDCVREVASGYTMRKRGACCGEATKAVHETDQSEPEKVAAPPSQSEQGSRRVIGRAELALHSTKDDAWIAIRNKVYDVTKFAPRHPGGPVLYTYAGKDATDVFAAFHAPETWSRLPEFSIGEFQPLDPTPELIQDFRSLKVEMHQRGLYRSSKLFYAYKFSTTLMLLGLALAVSYFGRHSLPLVLLGGCLLGLFWQQAGWMAHDFCHNQVFKNRWLNHFVGGYVMGNLLQGFSALWWKWKHNKHHAAPNECDEEYHPVDPDIDTLPFLAWSDQILSQVQSKALRRLLRWQSELFFPLLLFARLAWCHSSFSWAFSDVCPKDARLMERSLILAHYTWLIAFACCLPVPMALLWLVTAQMVGGLCLGFVFVQSHNGMEVYNDEKDFFSAQIVSTRDVVEGPFNNWFSGGLNRQIEHHLFPTLPRHSLKEASRMVEALCQKHGLDYQDVNWSKGTGLVLQHLSAVAASA